MVSNKMSALAMLLMFQASFFSPYAVDAHRGKGKSKSKIPKQPPSEIIPGAGDQPLSPTSINERIPIYAPSPTASPSSEIIPGAVDQEPPSLAPAFVPTHNPYVTPIKSQTSMPSTSALSLSPTAAVPLPSFANPSGTSTKAPSVAPTMSSTSMPTKTTLSSSPTTAAPLPSPPVQQPSSMEPSSTTSIMPTVRPTSVIAPGAGDQSSSPSPTFVSIHNKPFASSTGPPLLSSTMPSTTKSPTYLQTTMEPSASPTVVVGILPSLLPTLVSGCPNLSVADRHSALREAVIEVSGEHVLTLPDSSQSQAFAWLADQDSLRVCPDDTLMLQRYALAVLYFATVGDQWFTCDRHGNKSCAKESFLSGVDVCLWGGITCDYAKHVLNINIDSNNLQGTIPSEIEVLQSLVEFDVEDNTISGSIPSGFGKLSFLNFLDLDTNSLLGEIPEALFNLTSLIALDLDSNNLTGTISSRIGLLTSLFIVQLDNNNFQGELPTEMGLLTNLGYFTATGNQLTGHMPDALCGLPSEALEADCDLCVPAGCCTACTN